MDTDEIEREERVLAKADTDIAEGSARVRDQSRVVDELRASGRPTEQAERLLRVMEATLAEWRKHRMLIIDRLAVLREAVAHRTDPGMSSGTKVG